MGWGGAVIQLFYLVDKNKDITDPTQNVQQLNNQTIQTLRQNIFKLQFSCSD